MEKSGLNTEEMKKQSPENYFQDILEITEFEGLKKLVEDSNGIISWDKLTEEWVVKIKTGKIEWIYWKGKLDLRWTRLKSLWKIKTVTWWLACEEVETLENIWELEEVWWSLLLTWTRVKTLWRLKKVNWWLDCEGVETLEDLWKLEEIWWWLNLIRTKIKSLWKLKKIWQHLNCYGLETLEDLWELEEVWLYLYLEWCNIKIQLEVIRKVGEEKLKVGVLKHNEYIDRLYEKWNLKYEEFEEIFGYDIKEIEDNFTRRQAIWILEREYKNKKEEIKNKFEEIKEKNQGKDLTEEEKREIKDEIKGWDIELKEVREKIASFGVIFSRI